MIQMQFYAHDDFTFFQLKIEDERKFPTFQSISVREKNSKKGKKKRDWDYSRIHSESSVHLRAQQWIAWNESIWC